MARGLEPSRTHSSACSSTGTSVPDRVVSLLLGLFSLTFLQVLPVRLESRDNVELFSSTLTGFDGTSVDHETGSVQSSKGHEGSGHVLVTTGYDDHSIEPMTTGGGLDLIGDEITGLQRVAHSECSHGDSIGYTDGTELVAD